MKTAMQELILWVGQYEGKMISADQVVLKAYDLLEKEKENIINAYSIGFLVSKDLDMTEVSSYITEDYYNQAHNQNK